MLRRSLIIVALLAAFSMASMADVIHLKSGRTLEVDNAQVIGDKVVFTVFNGHMSVSRNSVVKIVKTEGKADPRAGLRPIVGNPTFATTAATRKSPLSSEGGEEESSATQEALKHFKDARLRLLKELRFTTEQIKTLQSTIFAKAAINASTAQDRARLLKFQRDQNDLKAQLEEIPFQARIAGLEPGDIREIENTRLEENEDDALDATIIGDDDPDNNSRNANVEMDEGVDDDSSRNSDVELKEDPPIIK